MNKYYHTMSPDAARHILRATESETINEAKAKVSEDGRTRYIVKIVAIVGRVSPPVKVTRVK